MASNTLKDPQVYISNEARTLFDSIKKFPDFQKFVNKDFFMFAMLLGYYQKKKKSLKRSERTESGYARERYFANEDMEFIKAVAVSETGDLRVIESVPAMFSIAEEYVNGGISFLRDLIFENPADFVKKFAGYLRKNLAKQN